MFIYILSTTSLVTKLTHSAEFGFPLPLFLFIARFSFVLIKYIFLCKLFAPFLSLSLYLSLSLIVTLHLTQSKNKPLQPVNLFIS